MTLFLTPTEPSYYRDPERFPTAALESLAERAAYNGSYIAANSGADHPMAEEWRTIYVAVTTVLIERGIGAVIEDEEIA